jgi:hypothetical protein
MNPHPHSPEPERPPSAVLLGLFLATLNASTILLLDDAPEPGLFLVLSALAPPLIFLGIAGRPVQRAPVPAAWQWLSHRGTPGPRWLDLEDAAERLLFALDVGRPTGVRTGDLLGHRFHRAWVEGYLRPRGHEDGFHAARQATPPVTGYGFPESREGWLSGEE